jgi:hypothetical protein
MVEEQELEHAGPRLDDVRGLGVDHHAVGGRDRARHLQLRHLLDLDQADATVAIDRQTGVIAVVRNVDPALDRGLQHRRALGNADRAAVDGESDSVHIDE